MSDLSISVGELATDFTLLSGDGREIYFCQTLQNSSVVLFLLKAFMPLCTKQVCGFQRDLTSFQSRNAPVLGISSDSELTPSRFPSVCSLFFPLLIDSRSDVRKLFRVPRVLGFIGRRTTFVIGRDRKIANVTHAQTGSQIHIEESQRFLPEL